MTDKNFNNMDISIIVPLFHGTKYIENILHMVKKNIESAIGINVELVFVNDSPDDVPDFSSIEESEYPIHIILNEENLGIQRSRLRGVEHSDGEYLFFLDQDDVISDDAMIRLFEAADGREVGVSDWQIEETENGQIRIVDRTANVKRFTVHNFCHWGNVIGPPGHCIIRRDCLPVCWIDKIMKASGADDFLLWIGLLSEECSFVHCDGALYIHKLHSGCFSNDTLKMLESEAEAFGFAADEYGISRFWRFIHRRSISYRRMCVTIRKCGQNSKFSDRMCLLLYPELLLLRAFVKLGINV